MCKDSPLLPGKGLLAGLCLQNLNSLFLTREDGRILPPKEHHKVFNLSDKVSSFCGQQQRRRTQRLPRHKIGTLLIKDVSLFNAVVVALFLFLLRNNCLNKEFKDRKERWIGYQGFKHEGSSTMSVLH